MKKITKLPPEFNAIIKLASNGNNWWSSYFVLNRRYALGTYFINNLQLNEMGVYRQIGCRKSYLATTINRRISQPTVFVGIPACL